MGWAVIGKGTIEFLKDTPKTKQITPILNLMKKDRENFYSVQLWKDQSISFEMSGNKGINYKPLDKIVSELTKLKVDFEITVNEFSEVGDGYYHGYEVEE